jgi:enoyl-CoA hydratase/carnithine racemase
MAVDFSKEGRVGFVTLNRPPANSYDHAFIDELEDAVDSVAHDDEVRVTIVRSASKRFFCAGADIKAFTGSDVDGNMAMIETAHGVLARIAEVAKVFIAEIGAHALGGGLEIALACDLRFAGEGSYRIGLPEATLGLLPGNGGTQRLPRLIGKSKALELMVTGDTLTPEEARDAGILNRLFPEGALAKETLEFAQRLAAGAPKAIGAIKLAVHRGMDQRLDDALRLERELIEPLFRSEDADEGFSAFMEKRRPTFRGK